MLVGGGRVGDALDLPHQKRSAVAQGPILVGAVEYPHSESNLQFAAGTMGGKIAAVKKTELHYLHSAHPIFGNICIAKPQVFRADPRLEPVASLWLHLLH